MEERLFYTVSSQKTTLREQRLGRGPTEVQAETTWWFWEESSDSENSHCKGAKAGKCQRNQQERWGDFSGVPQVEAGGVVHVAGRAWNLGRYNVMQDL